MAEGADEELLARLGVVAANPNDYERVLLAQVEEQAREAAGEELEEQGGDDGEAAQEFLREVDPEVTAGKGRIRSILGSLEKEIAAVTAAQDAFNEPDSGDEKADGAETSAKKRKKKGPVAVITKDGGEAMHKALLDERLESLKRRQKSLIGKYKVLEKSEARQESGAKSLPSGILKGEGSSSVNKKGKEQAIPKRRTIAFVEDDDFDTALDAAIETEREHQIRKGVITPFSKVGGFERRVQSRPRERPSANEEPEDGLVRRSIANAAASMSAINKARPTTQLLESSELPRLEAPARGFRQLRTPFKRVTADEGDEKPGKSRSKPRAKRKRPQADKKWRKRVDVSSDSESDSLEDAKAAENLSVSDDDTASRQTPGKKRRLRLVSKSNEDVGDPSANGNLEGENLEDDEEDEAEEEMDVVLEGGLKVPGAIYDKLFNYQQTGVKWMWELHCQKAGGIIGDEMGLGKTIQVIAFLAALHHSGLYRPSIVVCPVTLLRQWKREVKKWYPSFRVVILHDSALKGGRAKKFNKTRGSLEEAKSSESERDEDRSDSESDPDTKKSTKKSKRWDAMIKGVTDSDSGLLITTYEQLRIHREKLLDLNWGYAVLDEGHRIRNPDADVTLVCKQLQTVHRLIMTGAPIQNRLTELWSLFDFVFPGKLGVLPVFRAQFGLPIQIGGYANATPLQVSTAYKCAVVLRDLILPYLLRRMKVDVDANLTKKTEHVLFCSLSTEQRAAYRAFLGSSEVEQIMEGSRNSLYGIDILRKICNHPDLLEREHCAGNPDYGNPERSGKLKLVMQILTLWKSQGHRVLIFAQTQQMLDILQGFAESQDYEYRRMDGSTAVKHRMALIDEFNESEHVFLFILTTKVGGLGTNLVGANRVIIFDPDWNPSTDMQARERAWRIGQKKDVTVYRLITRGTIEEKVYHRQIYKHFLTNKILKDPLQKRIFKARDMRDLFTLQEETHGSTKTETASLFGEVEDMLSGGRAIQTGEEAILRETDAGTSRSGSRRQALTLEQQIPLDKLDAGGKKSSDNGDEDTKEEESRILKNLFQANGIHSAMDHDAILAVSESEKVMVDQEAGRVAQRAADELRRSRMLRSSDNIAVPTWTGRSGEAGAPNSVRRRFGSATNTRLVSVTAVQTTTGSSAQVRSVQEFRSDVSSSVRQFGGVGAGSAAGKALTSSDVLSRMRERQMGALGAGIDGAGPSSSSNMARGSPAASLGGPGLLSSVPGSHETAAASGAPLRRFGRGGGGLASASGVGPESGRGRGLVTSNISGRSAEVAVVQSEVPNSRIGRGEAALPPREGLQSSAPPSASGRGPDTSASLSGGSQFRAGQPGVLLADIRAFILQNGGSVGTDTIVAHFRTRITSGDRSLFKQLLTEVASREKGVGGTFKWVLKPIPTSAL